MAIGEKLRQVRKERQITLEEAESLTKIRRKYIAALENEQFQVLPDRVYARYFLVSYARFLNLKIVELVQKFDRIYPPDADDHTCIQKVTGTLAQPEERPGSSPYKHPAIARLAADRDMRLMAQIRKVMTQKRLHSS